MCSPAHRVLFSLSCCGSDLDRRERLRLIAFTSRKCVREVGRCRIRFFATATSATAKKFDDFASFEATFVVVHARGEIFSCCRLLLVSKLWVFAGASRFFRPKSLSFLFCSVISDRRWHIRLRSVRTQPIAVHGFQSQCAIRIRCIMETFSIRSRKRSRRTFPKNDRASERRSRSPNSD